MKIPEGLPEFEYKLWRTVLQVVSNKRTRNHTTIRGRQVRIEPEQALLVGEILPLYRGIAPAEEVRRGLRMLTSQGYLRWGRTMNDVYFVIDRD